jgi:hypothetical protein
VNELQLVGYTADLRYLVFADASGTSRFRTPVDGDLFETLQEILELVDPDQAEALGLPQPEPEPEPEPVPEPEPEPPGGDPTDNGEAERSPWPPPGEGGIAGVLLARLPEPEPEPEPAPEDDGAGKHSLLSPREIQARLRAGTSLQAVAREADTDETWVRRWLPPIEAERERIIQAVQRSRVVKARLGPSHDRVGDAVRRNLVAKSVDPDDESVQWSASRREGQSFWAVTLRYRSRGRVQRAVWRFDPEIGSLEPADPLAGAVGWTGPNQRVTRRPARKASKKAAKKGAQKRARKGTKKGVKKAGKRAATRTRRPRR